MAEFWTSTLWPLIIMIAQSVLLLVVLLIAIAYILLADRKIWAAVQIRRGPNVVGPWGLLQSFADLLKFVLKEPIIPSGANKGVFLLAPLFVAYVFAAIPALLFVLLYKLGDQAITPMIKPFWVDRHLTLKEIGLISTTLGIVFTILALSGFESVAPLGEELLERTGVRLGTTATQPEVTT